MEQPIWVLLILLFCAILSITPEMEFMKQMFLYVTVLSIALLGAYATWFTSSNIEQLIAHSKKAVKRVKIIRAVCNICNFVALSFSSAGLLCSFIFNTGYEKLKMLLSITVFCIAVSVFFLGVVFIKLQKK